ncbi:peptide-N(4)-(N-acetyl-beta-glucosaminyl)asparagine amidase-like [Eutrema salsugineum]|uniref:peptide-N(4)-(N-acetyl-beta- glucosaminyl)asparagine amidase-like n=1 Tax=Eutrema salsugineum TaxID=72664 RepID=UPI000CECE724|nr:peptide-N(4)-(N-acetyl-beta-glucosaminyl)asparagine amidase-like [Eutrema salsugineum]
MSVHKTVLDQIVPNQWYDFREKEIIFGISVIWEKWWLGSLFIRHRDLSFNIDYDTENGLEVLGYQIFSLTFVPPDEQKIVAEDDDDRVVLVSDETDLTSISDKLRLVSAGGNSEDKSEGTSGKSEKSDADMVKSDEELARMLQAEEDAMMFQQYVAAKDSSELERRIGIYVSQVLMYEDPVSQEAARKTVPIDELEEKALVSLAKVIMQMGQ